MDKQDRQSTEAERYQLPLLVKKHSCEVNQDCLRTTEALPRIRLCLQMCLPPYPRESTKQPTCPLFSPEHSADAETARFHLCQSLHTQKTRHARNRQGHHRQLEECLGMTHLSSPLACISWEEFHLRNLRSL